jgi:hypothetical protein
LGCLGVARTKEDGSSGGSFSKFKKVLSLLRDFHERKIPPGKAMNESNVARADRLSGNALQSEFLPRIGLDVALKVYSAAVLELKLKLADVNTLGV